MGKVHDITKNTVEYESQDDHERKKDLIKFLFEHMDKKGIKYFEGFEMKVVGAEAKVSPDQIMGMEEDKQLFVQYKKPKAPEIRSADPFALRPEEKL